MKKTKLTAAVAAVAMAITSATSIPFSASAETRVPYMLGDVNGDLYVDASDASWILSALDDHGFEEGNRVSVTFVQNHLSDWFPKAVCAKAADANEDGYISHEDASDVLTYYSCVSTGESGYKNIGNLYLYIAN